MSMSGFIAVIAAAAAEGAGGGGANVAVTAAISDDGGAFTDYTTEANEATADDVVLLPGPAATNDAFYIGYSYMFAEVVINVSTATDGGTIVWEYYNGASWASLGGVEDDTLNFTSSGTRSVIWAIPTDWDTTTINSQGPYYYARARVVTGAGSGQTALAAQCWIGTGDPEPDPPGAPQDLHASNNGVNYWIAWSDAVAQSVEVYRDDVEYGSVGPGVEIIAAGTMFGDGEHTWKARHIGPTGDWSNEITTVDGIVGGGGGPTGSPSGLSTYEYAGGSKFGIQWSNGDETASTEVERDDAEYGGAEPGVSSMDVGLKAGDGTHTWKARHFKNGVYSDYSSEITTTNGEEV